MIRALRLHQWSKNLLLLLPIFCAHQAGNGVLWEPLALAFLFFSLGASGQYLLNDLLDRGADGAHPEKSTRPIAQGDIAPWQAVAVAALLIGVALVGAWRVNREFFEVVALYQVLTTAYSVKLKHRALMDVIVLACLFTLRVFAGGAATNITVSPWLLTFALFFFLMLAVLKRFAELEAPHASEGVRDYRPGDQFLLASMGISAGFLSVLVLAFYIQQPQTVLLYSRPDRLWLLCPVLLYWISRMWLIAHRGDMRRDPLDFALLDGVSYLVLGVSAVVAYAAI
jgi:4-hydroxybenzoate polyprenyltransferase